jgi:hypothetical protein
MADKVLKHYRSKNARFSLGGYIKQRKNPDGTIDQPDVSIDFENHWYHTDDPKIQAFIEKSKDFKDRVIWDVPDTVTQEITSKVKVTEIASSSN